MEKLTLPAGPREIWQACRRPVEEMIEGHSPRQTYMAIGGGTILAARWNHRRSTDIDVLIPPEIDEAIGHFERALRIRPDHGQARRNLELAREIAAELERAGLR